MTRVAIYDSTLRDGTQAEGIDFSATDKVRLTRAMDEAGMDYIEGGWPGSNDVSREYFRAMKSVRLKHAKLAAFGSTRHASKRAAKDPNLAALLESRTPVVTIFGKSWDLHVREALRVPLATNIEMIRDSVAFLKSKGKEVVYDAEHFFDGFSADREYALATLRAAAEGGADCLCLCETNGGGIPSRVAAVTREICARFPRARIGIHTHNDAGCGVANALAAIEAGATHVQGTMNGYGERCGNCNLVPVIAGLELKMGRATGFRGHLDRLTVLSHLVDEVANLPPDIRAPYVGRAAFAHKGGIHVSAVVRNPACYEHVPPASVGNRRRVLVTDQSGKSNLVVRLKELGVKIDADAPEMAELLSEIKRLEHEGYDFEAAEASYVLLLDRIRRRLPVYFRDASWRVLDENLDGENFVLGVVKLSVGTRETHAAAEGDGPVNALDLALRQALVSHYPAIERVKLIDYKVRVLATGVGTGARVRVLIVSSDGKRTWDTVGVSANIIEASWKALLDGYLYYLHHIARVRPRGKK